MKPNNDTKLRKSNEQSTPRLPEKYYDKVLEALILLQTTPDLANDIDIRICYPKIFHLSYVFFPNCKGSIPIDRTLTKRNLLSRYPKEKLIHFLVDCIKFVTKHIEQEYCKETLLRIYFIENLFITSFIYTALDKKISKNRLAMKRVLENENRFFLPKVLINLIVEYSNDNTHKKVFDEYHQVFYKSENLLIPYINQPKNSLFGKIRNLVKKQFFEKTFTHKKFLKYICIEATKDGGWSRLLEKEDLKNNARKCCECSSTAFMGCLSGLGISCITNNANGFLIGFFISLCVDGSGIFTTYKYKYRDLCKIKKS